MYSKFLKTKTHSFGNCQPLISRLRIRFKIKMAYWVILKMSRSNFHENEINEGQNQFLIVPDLKLSLQAISANERQRITNIDKLC